MTRRRLAILLAAVTFAAAAVTAAGGCQGRPAHPAPDNADPGRRVAADDPRAGGPARPYRVYVTNERSGDVSVIDAATNRVVQTIPVGKRPRGVRVGRDGKTVYVAL